MFPVLAYSTVTGRHMAAAVNVSISGASRIQRGALLLARLRKTGGHRECLVAMLRMLYVDVVAPLRFTLIYCVSETRLHRIGHYPD